MHVFLYVGDDTVVKSFLRNLYKIYNVASFTDFHLEDGGPSDVTILRYYRVEAILYQAILISHRLL